MTSMQGLNDRVPIEITSRRGNAVLMSRADYDALEETAHLLRSPANARRLLESLDQASVAPPIDEGAAAGKLDGTLTPDPGVSP